MPKEAGHREAQAALESTMKRAVPTAAGKLPEGPGLLSFSTRTPWRKTGFESESWLEINRLVVVMCWHFIN